MLQELKFQLSTAILTILTLGASVAAVVNFGQYERFHLADDGVIWVDRAGGVEALHVSPSSPGDNKGSIHLGDHLERINGITVKRALDVPQILARIGSWQEATYTINHAGVPVEAPHILIGEAPKNPAIRYLDAIGATYLLIGLFVD